MKTLKLKGFSLIECIVAIALIGIASLLMAQVYGSVALMNKNNARLNTSLTEQMKFAERELKEDADYKDKNVTKIRLHSYNDGTAANVDPVSFKMTDESVNKSLGFTFGTSAISADVDVIVLKSKDDTSTDKSDSMNKKGSTAKRVYEMDDTVRYKFILPKS